MKSRTVRISNWLCAVFFGVLLMVSAMAGILPGIPKHLTWVSTESIPTGLYIAEKLKLGAVLSKNEIVCFRYVPPAWAKDRGYARPGTGICKIVVGVPGDNLTPVEGGLSLCPQSFPSQCTKIGPIKETDRKGRTLPAYWKAKQVLGPTQYFLIGTNSDYSFDSRYLGPIDKGLIYRKIQKVGASK